MNGTSAGDGDSGRFLFDQARKAVMTPIRKLLNRIRWDRAFGQAEFLVGYLDRIENRIILVGLREIHFPKGAPDSFELEDAEGLRHRVPYHRVKEVYRNGERIWRRTH